MNTSNPENRDIAETGALIRKESKPLVEELTLSNRVVVYGSRLSGTFELADKFKEHLKEQGVPNPVVSTCRNVEMINDAFYDIRDPQWETVDTSKQIPTLPRGVIVFPEMRLIRSAGPAMTIPTPYEYIKGLCDKHGIPIVQIGTRGSTTRKQLSQSIIKVLEVPKST